MRPKLIAALVAAIVALPSPAIAAQLDAREPPTVSGPLVPVMSNCERRVETSRRGRIIAVTRSCLWFYSLPVETDRDRNYGALWLQTNVNSRNGWCTTSVKSDIGVNDKVTIESRAPSRTIRTKGPRSVTTRLSVDADGTAPTPGALENTFRLYPQVLRPRLLDDGELFRARWRGSSARKLGFASGAEISWSADEPSPGALTSGLSYRFEKKEVC